jgi:hypothetical protein
MSLGVAYVPLPFRLRGPWKARLVTFTYDGAYSGGGYAVAASSVGLSSISYVSPATFGGTGDLGFVTEFDYATGKQMIRKAGTADAPLNEADTNQANLDTKTSKHIVIGK